jgi:Flp pilus assembly protein TadD
VPSPVAPVLAGSRSGKRLIAKIAALVVIAALATGTIFYFHRVPKLLGKDSIILADFTNTTGDPVFDGALRQGLAVQLEQSPFLNVISDEQISQTLGLMAQPRDAKLSRQLANEVCQRDGGAAVLDGSIANLGGEYVIGLRAVSCYTGQTLAQTQVTASDKKQVLSALGKAATQIRAQLGESLTTMQKFHTPVEEATTPSLEALQAYTFGRNAMTEKADFAAAVPLFQRAIRLDPNFAMAYASLGMCYSNLGETILAAGNTRKSYELREHVSDGEKFYIESHYYHVVTGDLEKARQVYELWAQAYPRDFTPQANLGGIYIDLGWYDKSLEADREAFLLNVARDLSYADLVEDYIFLNRLGEAQATAGEAQAKKLDSPKLRGELYVLAFLQNDAEGMLQQVAWGAGKPGVEDRLLALEAETAAYSGRLGKARELSRRAVASAELAGEKETAAAYNAFAALRESLFGNAAEARKRASAALGFSSGREVQYAAALALAFAGEEIRSQVLADDLAKRFAEDTLVQYNYLPTIRAQLLISRNDSSKAIEALQTAGPYESGSPSIGSDFSPAALYPIYVRGQAYLAAHQGSEATAEFQKILDHRGVVLNELIGALAHLGLARAYALQGDTAKARAAYNDFLTLWKDADPDIPVLQQAKAEYPNLK